MDREVDWHGTLNMITSQIHKLVLNDLPECYREVVGGLEQPLTPGVSWVILWVEGGSQYTRFFTQESLSTPSPKTISYYI